MWGQEWAGLFKSQRIADEADNVTGMRRIGTTGGGDVGMTVETQYANHCIAQGRHDLRDAGLVHCRAIFIKGHIPHPMRAVLDTPVTAAQLEQAARGRLGGREAGDAIHRLTALPAILLEPRV